MSTASTAAPSVVRSPSQRKSSAAAYTPTATDNVQRKATLAIRPASTAASGGIQRSSSQSYARPASNQLTHVARRDNETTNLARPASMAISKTEQEAALRDQNAGLRRSEITRDSRHGAPRHSHGREESRTTDTTSSHGEKSKKTPGATSSAAPLVRKRTSITAQTGTWALGKTIGAGSMGKVKLAKHTETGEQVAVKIVPRQSTDEHRTEREKERADHSKEVRTAREAAIVTLLNHPYICGMRDVQRTNYHWYMLFEYVNGGQMLDYIISHGRLKEKQARKFARQIASALDYCHRNSIVHRDLKIENILISKTGDIKIIDFGLSNLFSPKNWLKTFCGSLYFAAPELLQARQYTGPEVDIWSFGIVLFVLVCGKVPFDDQSMPQLHAKIKKGVVDYPPWLSPECKNLISRMLVTDPARRITMTDILNHPWLNKGFNGPPDNYIPNREPLQLPLDPQIIEKMTGFDFGSSDYISRELTRVISSDEYQTAVKNHARDQAHHSSSAADQRKGVFGFYKRRNSTTSRDTLPNSSSEAVLLGLDPVNAFSPLISIYYLVREKQERERQETTPGATKLPLNANDKPLQLPDLPAPEPAFTNVSAFEMAGEQPTGGRSRARSRTQGEDDVVADLRKQNFAPAPSQNAAPAASDTPDKKEGGIGLLRRFSTRKSRDYRAGRETREPPALQVQPPVEAEAPVRKSFSVRRRTSNQHTPSSLQHTGGSTPNAELLSPQQARDTQKTTAPGINRSASVNSGDYRLSKGPRAPSVEAHPGNSTNDPPLTSGSERSSMSGDWRNKTGTTPTTPEQKPVLLHRASTTKARSGYGRRESAIRRTSRRDDGRQPSDVPEETYDDIVASADNPNRSIESIKPVYLKGLFSVSTTSNRPLPVIRMDIVRVLNQLSVSWAEIKGGFMCHHAPSIDLKAAAADAVPTSATGQVGSDEAQAGTTSEKANLNRRISFAGGNRPRPSTNADDASPTNEKYKEKPSSRMSMSIHRRSKVLPSFSSHTPSKDTTTVPGTTTAGADTSLTASSGSESDLAQRTQHQRSARLSKQAGGLNNNEQTHPDINTTGTTDFAPSNMNNGASMAAGETTTHVQNDFGEGMVLRFEIFIVKVPLFSLHGIQFKKVQGGTWQYKEMASKILEALRL